ncbi:MAG: hypothetical protein ACPGVN_03155 [Alphaproteobacteria bacterium]
MTLAKLSKAKPKWRAKAQANLAELVNNGVTVYGVRGDGSYVARSSEGERVLSSVNADGSIRAKTTRSNNDGVSNARKKQSKTNVPLGRLHNYK